MIRGLAGPRTVCKTVLSGFDSRPYLQRIRWGILQWLVGVRLDQAAWVKMTNPSGRFDSTPLLKLYLDLHKQHCDLGADFIAQREKLKSVSKELSALKRARV